MQAHVFLWQFLTHSPDIQCCGRGKRFVTYLAIRDAKLISDASEHLGVELCMGKCQIIRFLDEIAGKGGAVHKIRSCGVVVDVGYMSSAFANQLLSHDKRKDRHILGHDEKMQDVAFTCVFNEALMSQRKGLTVLGRIFWWLISDHLV